MGKLTNIHKIGRIIVAHAVKLHYLGMGTDRDFDMGIVRNHLVMFRDSPRFHMMSFGMNTMVFGNVQRLRIM
jgi:hypothetical protein